MQNSIVLSRVFMKLKKLSLNSDRETFDILNIEIEKDSIRTNMQINDLSTDSRYSFL